MQAGCGVGPRPGEVITGLETISDVWSALLATDPAFNLDVRKALHAGEIALSFVGWTLSGTGPEDEAVEMAAQTSDVQRRRADGTWRFVIDNPYGGAHGF
jgi:ketosteroid isomerase-like protein